MHQDVVSAERAHFGDREDTIKNKSDWDPFKFVDWCQLANSSDGQKIPPALVNWLQKLQVVEFSNLLEYSFQQSLA